ncbi:MAG: alpha/beta fold hydrolase [Vicinamibacterales bacterium]
MRTRIIAFCLCLLTSTAGAAELRNLKMPLADGGDLLYGLSLPDGYVPGQARPLVLALHPGGMRMVYYGSAYTRAVVQPALAGLGAIIVAPDCPTNAWTDATSERAVMALLDRIVREYLIDRARVLVVGFSMGGRGTWFFSSRHPELFTAAIPMAAGTGDEPSELLARMPTYIIHSRRDEVVPFAPAERNARALERLGRTVVFEPLDTPTHFDMGAYIPALRRAGVWVAARWMSFR